MKGRLSNSVHNLSNFYPKRVWSSISGKNFSGPDFIIVGAQKAGTSSLFNYLVQHPEIQAAARKEVHYFDLNYSKSREWYESFFPLRNDQDSFITGEASPYYMFHPYAMERISKFYPHIKIIILLRNPINRAISHYYHEVRKGREKLEMLEAFMAEEKRIGPELEKFQSNPFHVSLIHQWYSYKSRGVYVDQIKRIKSQFPDKNILILESDTFYNRTRKTLSEVFNFLGITDTIEINHERVINRGQYNRNQLSSSVTSYLSDYFKEYNVQLIELLNQKFEW